MSKHVIVIGAGFSGSTVAYLLKNKGYKLTILEAASHPGGGCWTRYHGKYHIRLVLEFFYTPMKKTFEFLNSFVELRQFKTCSYIERRSSKFITTLYSTRFWNSCRILNK